MSVQSIIKYVRFVFFLMKLSFIGIFGIPILKYAIPRNLWVKSYVDSNLISRESKGSNHVLAS